jgi:hypothetical protein
MLANFMSTFNQPPNCMRLFETTDEYTDKLHCRIQTKSQEDEKIFFSSLLLFLLDINDSIITMRTKIY